MLGCLRRQDRNVDCEWPQESHHDLDLRNTVDQRHLRDDAQFAEELAIRYSDPLRQAEGLTEARDKRNRCMENLFATIATLHGVTKDDVRHAASERDWRIDFAFVTLPMALAFALFSYHLCGRVFHAVDARSSAALLVLILSVLVSFCGVMVGEMWALAVEIIRIGNGHLSFRTARIPWSDGRRYLFGSGLLLFWLIAAFRYHTIANTPRRPTSAQRFDRQLGLE
jgi:hypothetical protein